MTCAEVDEATPLLGHGSGGLQKDCCSGAASYSTSFAVPTAGFGSKTIGLYGSIMLLANNLSGPGISLMPALAQEAGWVPFLLVVGLVGGLSIAMGHMTLTSMRAMPDNDEFQRRVEYIDMSTFYLPWPITWLVLMPCYLVNLTMSLMAYIVQTAQVLDLVILDVFGCAPGVALLPAAGAGLVCGHDQVSSTPFDGEAVVLSSAMVVVACLCAPLALRNLNENIVSQWVAVLGLVIILSLWLGLLMVQPTFPTRIPVATTHVSDLIGTVLFNFAFASTLPSWANEKRRDVSVATCFNTSIAYIVLIYTAVAIFGGLAFAPFFLTSETLFSKLNASGTLLGRATVAVYPIVQNITTIPVLSIMVRYNLVQSGVPFVPATLLAVVMPWLLSVLFYTGKGFAQIASVGGLATSSVVNFAAPATFFILARMRSVRSSF